MNAPGAFLRGVDSLPDASSFAGEVNSVFAGLLIASVGAVILWFGWYGFNPGSTLSAMDMQGIARVAANTTLAACALGAFLLAAAIALVSATTTALVIAPRSQALLATR